MRMSRGESIWYSAGRMFIVDTAAGVDSGGRPGRGEGAVWEPGQTFAIKGPWKRGNL